jgi:hypothetical protein
MHYIYVIESSDARLVKTGDAASVRAMLDGEEAWRIRSIHGFRERLEAQRFEESLKKPAGQGFRRRLAVKKG